LRIWFGIIEGVLGVMWILVRPDAELVWRNREVKERLAWYKAVMDNRKPAKYLIAKRVHVEGELKELSYEELWKRHSEAIKEFYELLDNVRNNDLDIESIPIASPNLIDLKSEIARRILRNCIFCERRCGVNREAGMKGFCGLDARTYVASEFLHMGEESPLVPSGTIFFTGCSFKCVFCQNWDISQHPLAGEPVDAKRLARIATDLRRRGARNINYVGGNPDQQLHTIIESLKYMNINVPLLWNSNMYLTLQSLDLLLEIIDIWLPDFKYGSDECAMRLSNVDRYYEVVTRNLKILADKNEDAIIRHLVLPNHLECCTVPILEWISKNYPKALVNVMAQYRPEYQVALYPDKWRDIARRPSSSEMSKAYTLARKLGLCFEPVS